MPRYCDHSTVGLLKITALREPSDSFEITEKPASPRPVPTQILPRPKTLTTTEPEVQKALPVKAADSAARVCIVGATPYWTLACQKGS
jgi:hypothetical protein